MPEETSHREAALVGAQVADTGQPDTVLALPRASLVPRIALPRVPAGVQRPAAYLALAALLAGCAVLAVFASSGPTVLVWHSPTVFPGWMAGPLQGLFGHLPHRVATLSVGFLGVSLAMLIAYGLVLRYARWLSMRTIWVFVLAALAILALGPPLQATDLFNYLGYARLWALHGLNPYTHVIGGEAHDPVWLAASWRNWRNPYGPLFTALTYPLGLMPLPVAYWVLKAVTVGLSGGFVWLVSRCARLAGRDPRWAVLLVAANPLFLIDAVGGFHNDIFMMVPTMAAIAFLLKGRDRSAGAAIAIATAVKFTAILILPFMLLATRGPGRRGRVLSGLALAGIPLAAASLAMFGTALPNVAGQSQVLTAFSIANLLGWALGFGGGAPVLLVALELCVVAVVVHQLIRNRDWVAGAGWATVALLVSLGSLWPWYIVWLLPLAAIASSVRLRAVALALTAFLVITTAPYTARILGAAGINPLSSKVGRASNTLVQQDTR